MRSDARTVVGLVAAVAVLALVVVAAAVGGSWQLEDRDFGGIGQAEPVETPPPTTPPRPRNEQGELNAVDLSWMGAVARVLLAGAVVVLLVLLWRRLRGRGVPARRAPTLAAGAASVEPEPDLPVLQRGAAEAQRFLDEVAGATDAVIAAWLALEEAAEASGVRRARAQTPTEFTLAVLERTQADPAATRELLALYHRARFSTQPVGPDDVARASACLGRLAASWAAVRNRSEAEA